jgi:hypothetical protein
MTGNTYSTNQFYGFNGTDGSPDPMGIARANIDNPPFLYPKKQYMDSAGRTHTVQRGYMRSLLTDPAIDLSGEADARRVFFQFNPVALQRSVQQMPGAMNPLLQDPAQLTQPVPGTATFAFELFFNREHEVNAGYNEGSTDWLMLPNGKQALVSEVGVLADLMMLDSITGQGISEDLIKTLISYSKSQYISANKDITDKIKAAKKRGDKDAAKTYQPLTAPTDAQMQKIFKANLGNTAFLNPQPFRVMFSALFMVEGIANSIDVVFQKFSRTMVPTQCKVTINMQAMYLGFAKRNTLLYDALSQKAAAVVAEATPGDKATVAALNNGVLGFKYQMRTFNTTIDQGNPGIKVFDIQINPLLLQLIQQRVLGDIKYQFYLDYHLVENPITRGNSSLYYGGGRFQATRVQLAQKSGKSDFEKGTKKVNLQIPEEKFKESMEDGDDAVQLVPYEPYVSFRLVCTMTATAFTSGNVFVSEDFVADMIPNYEWFLAPPGGVLLDKLSPIGAYVGSP